ncbi:IclR family transcriptional regulator [Oxalobacteraceae bacterium OM1]|nr:IclR family transcriptional regulator [Oxalobacteraceae bacterium OM1]
MTAPDASDDPSSASTTKSLEERYFITALSRGLDVLACFRPGDRALSNQQIAERCGLPKSTVTRIVFTLLQRGYLVSADNGNGYALGTATLALGSTMLARMDIRQFARPLMHELSEFASATLALGVRDRLSIIYTEVARSTATLALTLQVGSRVPLATSAIGRAYLAMASDRERTAVLRAAEDFDDAAVQAIRAGRERGARDVREYGCATSFGEWQKDVNGIAVAFRSSGPYSTLALNCGGPASSLSKEFLLDEVRPRLIRLADALQSSGLS